MEDKKYKKLIEEVRWKMSSNQLTGRYNDDGCTDGYDTEIVLLAKEIVDLVLGSGKDENKI